MTVIVTVVSMKMKVDHAINDPGQWFSITPLPPPPPPPPPTFSLKSLGDSSEVGHHPGL